jgi:hypothetical protein
VFTFEVPYAMLRLQEIQVLLANTKGLQAG